MLLGVRYYSPEIGRFWSLDPIRDGLNWYQYAVSNPVNFTDPKGLFGQNVFKNLWDKIKDSPFLLPIIEEIILEIIDRIADYIPWKGISIILEGIECLLQIVVFVQIIRITALAIGCVIFDPAPTKIVCGIILSVVLIPSLVYSYYMAWVECKEVYEKIRDLPRMKKI